MELLSGAKCITVVCNRIFARLRRYNGAKWLVQDNFVRTSLCVDYANKVLAKINAASYELIEYDTTTTHWEGAWSLQTNVRGFFRRLWPPKWSK